MTGGLPNALPLQKCCTEQDPDSVKTWYINGKRPVAGQIFKNPDLAKTFRLMQKGGAPLSTKARSRARSSPSRRRSAAP